MKDHGDPGGEGHGDLLPLVLGEELSGRVYVRDVSGGLLVELRKERSYP